MENSKRLEAEEHSTVSGQPRLEKRSLCSYLPAIEAGFNTYSLNSNSVVQDAGVSCRPTLRPYSKALSLAPPSPPSGLLPPPGPISAIYPAANLWNNKSPYLRPPRLSSPAVIDHFLLPPILFASRSLFQVGHSAAAVVFVRANDPWQETR
ncbi:hypothetical protein KM043_011690 [Ampulex compressa]|nr:hypothetical protein KM043_011690 [Ampulex compressa]